MIAGPRAEARKAGLKRFFNGHPCKNGHISERRVINGECVTCRNRTRPREKRRRPGRWIEVKVRAIEYLGGVCKDCRWKGHHSGFEFDHTNGRGGRKAISLLRRTTWTNIKRELDNHIELVCGTCHNIRTWMRRHTDA